MIRIPVARRPPRFGWRPPVLALLLLSFVQVGSAFAQTTSTDSIFLVQVSNTHWGFNNPKVNPDYAGTRRKGIAEINAVGGDPDFLIFTGDETHMTDDPVVRRQRMMQFEDIIKALAMKTIWFIPGEHDAAADNAKACAHFHGLRQGRSVSNERAGRYRSHPRPQPAWLG